MKRTIKFFLIMILVITLPIEGFLGETQPDVEVFLEMHKSIIRQGLFHEKMDFIFKGDSSDELLLTRIGVYHQTEILFEANIFRQLVGIGKEWEEYQNILDEYENLVKSGIEEKDILIIQENLKNLQSKIFRGMDIQTITIDSNELFDDTFEVGTIKTMNILIEYEYNQKNYIIEKTQSIEVLPPFPVIPVPEQALRQPPSVGPQWYFGDLHVHTGYSSISGYDDSYLDDCDNCGRELENPSGYTVEQLRNNALDWGRDWLTFTDHSYCIEDLNDCGISEWDHLLGEVNMYGYPNSPVLLVRSEEVSLEEDTCSIDIACHLGAQFINTYMPGGALGQDYLSQQGIDLANRQNGVSIINHPSSDVWDWCSENNTGETGVEIWNGDWDNNDANAVQYWVRRLMRGDKSFAFSGSDTHNTIEDYHPMNGVYMTTFTSEGLKYGLKDGHSFVTNGPALVLWGWSSSSYFQYDNSLMGNTVPRLSGETVILQVYYDMWVSGGGYIYMYRGTIGQPYEIPIGSQYVTGYGDIYFYDTPTGSNVYYRAEFISYDGNYRAFTNPVWTAIPNFGNLSGLFSNNSFFVAGDTAYCTDVLGSAKIGVGLAWGGAAENPEGRTDTILTGTEHSTGDLLIVGGPAVNPVAEEFDVKFGITYTYVENTYFAIHCEGYTLELDVLNDYPQEDICIVYIGKDGPRQALLVWGYGWRGTYAGSVFIADLSTWQNYSNSHVALLRWYDGNSDGLVQRNEIYVEYALLSQNQSFTPEWGASVDQGLLIFNDLASLFFSNSFFVAGDTAYCTDVLGSAKIGFGLGQGGIGVNPEGRTDIILTGTEHYAGNLILVGGPAVNPVTDEFDTYFGITYTYYPGSSFEIHADSYSISLNLNNYPREDICIVHLAEHNNRHVLLVWGYGWRGTYAGSVFIGDPSMWQVYADSHMLMLRWVDFNGDSLVQMNEIIVEHSA